MAQPSATPVNNAMVVLSWEEAAIQALAGKNPVDFVGTLFLALAASIAAPMDGEVPSAYKVPGLSGQVTEVGVRPLLNDLRVLMKEYSQQISKGFTSPIAWTQKVEVGDRSYEIVAVQGCFEVSYQLLDMNVRTVWSRTGRNSCRAG